VLLYLQRPPGRAKRNKIAHTSGTTLNAGRFITRVRHFSCQQAFILSGQLKGRQTAVKDRVAIYSPTRRNTFAFTVGSFLFGRRLVRFCFLIVTPFHLEFILVVMPLNGKKHAHPQHDKLEGQKDEGEQIGPMPNHLTFLCVLNALRADPPDAAFVSQPTSAILTRQRNLATCVQLLRTLPVPPSIPHTPAAHSAFA